MEQSGGSVIGVARALGQRCVVQRDADVAENRGEGVEDYGVIRCGEGGIAVVLQAEGIGHFAVLRHGNRGDRLDNGERRSDCRRNALGRVDVAEPRAADGDSVFDHAACFKRSKFRDRRFINQYGVAVCRGSDIAEHQTVRGADGRSRLQNAVDEIQRGILNVAQRLYCAGVEDIRAEVIGYGQICYRGIAVVDDAHGIGEGVACSVRLCGSRLCDAENALDRSDSDIRLHRAAVVAQGSCVSKCGSHDFSFPVF